MSKHSCIWLSFYALLSLPGKQQDHEHIIQRSMSTPRAKISCTIKYWVLALLAPLLVSLLKTLNVTKSKLKVITHYLIGQFLISVIIDSITFKWSILVNCMQDILHAVPSTFDALLQVVRAWYHSFFFSILPIEWLILCFHLIIFL